MPLREDVEALKWAFEQLSSEVEWTQLAVRDMRAYAREGILGRYLLLGKRGCWLVSLLLEWRSTVERVRILLRI